MKKIFIVICSLFLFACTPENTELSGEYKMINAPYNSDITISFNGSEFAGNSAVNRYFGTFEQNKHTIKFNVVGSTMMMGPENLMKTEQNYLNNLAQIDMFLLKNNTLTLKNSDGLKLQFKKI